ncbi:MAG: hypothetical protein QF561_06310 [Phycisphaerales bacterium]|jgi:hypothetical protein|nr:hypothetical protein [Phycisphaerales bacterium]
MKFASATALALTSMAAAQFEGTLEHAPPYMVADAAIIIEALDLDHADEQQIVLQLIEDFGAQWERLVDGYSISLHRDESSLDPEWQQARADYRSAARASAAATRALREIEAGLASVGSTDSGELQQQLEVVKASRERLLRATHKASAAMCFSMDRDSEHVNRSKRQFDADAAELTDQFERDVHLLLTRSQQDRWDALQLDFDRRRLLRHGHIGGEHLDLDVVSRRMQPPMSPDEARAIAPALDAWRRDVDTALARRTRLVNDEAAAPNASSRVDVLAATLQARRDVRDCSLRHLRTITEALGDERGSVFHRSAMHTAFPDQFRASRMERALRHCLDTYPDRSEAIAKIQSPHQTQMEQIRRTNLMLLLEVDGVEPLLAASRRSGDHRPELDAAMKQLTRLKYGTVDQRTLDRETFGKLEQLLGRARARSAMRAAGR